MITIKYSYNLLEVKGHANSDVIGKDLVCAGVSSIVIGALNWFNLSEIELINQIGCTKIKVISNFEENNKLLELIYIQLKALDHHDYKKYLLFERN